MDENSVRILNPRKSIFDQIRIMRTLQVFCFVILMGALSTSCKKKEITERQDQFEIDSTRFAGFFAKHPLYKEFQDEMQALYRKESFKYIWYDGEGRSEVADVLYDRARQIGAEGVPVPLPYAERYANIFSDRSEKPNLDSELLISAMYFFYAGKTIAGMDPATSKKHGWYLPRERVALVNYLDELLQDPDKIKKDEDENPQIYYQLRKGLQRYREISRNGGWGTISLPEGKQKIHPGENVPSVAQLRKRLALTGEFSGAEEGTVYDEPLVAAVKALQVRNGLNADGVVDKVMIDALNIPVAERIKTIVVNMERMRWLPDKISDLDEYIGVNIPAFQMHYVRDGKTVLTSRVIVGDEANNTVVFSGRMSYLVFSPYWNIPKSIVNEEIMPALEKDPQYLEKNDMEWNGEQLRQRPSDANSLGRVKFMFPNGNNIYLHDTPAKSLFKKEDRALSHGCVRVQKARELAIRILEGDKKWNVEKIDAAMRSASEQQYSLNRKIPVYIAYFTAVADENGFVAFFDDIYKRDNRLAKQLYNDKV